MTLLNVKHRCDQYMNSNDGCIAFIGFIRSSVAPVILLSCLLKTKGEHLLTLKSHNKSVKDK